MKNFAAVVGAVVGALFGAFVALAFRAWALMLAVGIITCGFRTFGRSAFGGQPRSSCWSPSS